MISRFQTLDSDTLQISLSSNILSAIPGILDWVWKIGRGLINQYSKKGMYEVLDFQTKLTILDPQGKTATLTKNMKKYDFFRIMLSLIKTRHGVMERYFKITNVLRAYR